MPSERIFSDAEIEDFLNSTNSFEQDLDWVVMAKEFIKQLRQRNEELAEEVFELQPINNPLVSELRQRIVELEGREKPTT